LIQRSVFLGSNREAIMPEAIPPPTWNDVLYELEGVQASHARVAGFFQSAPRAVRTLAPQPAAPRRGLSDRGADLVACCAGMNQIRFATLLHIEGGFPAQLDHAQLIAPACCILESELDRLVATPALSIIESLIAALRNSEKNGDQAATLSRWAEGDIPTTLGLATCVLLGLRRGIESGSQPIQEFLGARFSAVYRELLGNKKLDRCLNRINAQYRIPACHALKVFDASAYTEFARLMVANERFAAWNHDGPVPRPAGADAGILHHHLVHAGRAAPEPGASATLAAASLDPLARLTRLSTPRASPLRVEIDVERIDSPRDVSIRPPGYERSFRLGDRIRLAIRTTRSCHLTLIDVGTSGRVIVLRPNARRRDAWIEGGERNFLPDAEDPASTYELTGETGQERIVAIASLEAIEAIPLVPGPETPFRVLGSDDLERLGDALESGMTGWAAAMLAFQIEARR
jgi:hypothetical protein